VAFIIILEMLKKKYLQHVFHKQNVYNAIYKIKNNNKGDKPDSILLLDILFEKMSRDLR